MGLKILITGHQGFVGSHLWHAYDNGYNELRGVDIKEGYDARDFFRSDNGKWDLVFHCAAVVGGRAKIEGEPLDHRQHVPGRRGRGYQPPLQSSPAWPSARR